MIGRFVKMHETILGRRDLGGTAKLVFAVLADYADAHGNAWPGFRRIAERLGVSVNAVGRAIAQLEKVGIVEIDRRCNGQTNNYRTVFESTTVSTPERRQNEHGSSGPGNGDRIHFGVRGASKTNTEAPPKRRHNQKDLFNQTTDRARSKRSKRSKPKRDLWAEASSAMASDTLRTEAFKVAWASWCADRAERRKSPTSKAIGLQIKKLEAMGHDSAIQAIETSIANGWVGLFAPDKPHKHNGKGQPLPAAEGKYNFKER